MRGTLRIAAICATVCSSASKRRCALDLVRSELCRAPALVTAGPRRGQTVACVFDQLTLQFGEHREHPEHGAALGGGRVDARLRCGGQQEQMHTVPHSLISTAGGTVRRRLRTITRQNDKSRAARPVGAIPLGGAGLNQQPLQGLRAQFRRLESQS